MDRAFQRATATRVRILRVFTAYLPAGPARRHAEAQRRWPHRVHRRRQPSDVAYVGRFSHRRTCSSRTCSSVGKPLISFTAIESYAAVVHRLSCISAGMATDDIRTTMEPCKSALASLLCGRSTDHTLQPPIMSSAAQTHASWMSATTCHRNGAHTQQLPSLFPLFLDNGGSRCVACRSVSTLRNSVRSCTRAADQIEGMTCGAMLLQGLPGRSKRTDKVHSRM